MSAYTAPLLIQAQQITALDRVPLLGPESTEAYSEAWLQDLLFRFPQALPIADIDDAFLDLIPLCREMETPVGPVDVVYVTPNGKPVIVEAKLWRNPEARRKVVGQVLDYAKELSRFSFDNLDAAVRAARRTTEKETPPRGIIEIVKSAQPALDEARFVDSIMRSLRRGDLLLLVVGDGVREGVGAIADFLESHGTLQFTFGLVEMAIYRMPEDQLLVQPRVLAQSEIVRRFVVDLRNESLVAMDDDVGESESAPEVTEEILQSRVRYTKFWTVFLERLQLDDKSQPIPLPFRAQTQSFQMPPGSKSWISTYLAPSANRAGVYLTFAKGPTGDRFYETLVSDKEEIERAIGLRVEWKSDGEKHMIHSARTFSGLSPDPQNDTLMSHLSDVLNRFINVFRSRIQRLVDESN